MNRKANNALPLPHNNKSGTRKNSRVFIAPITRICVTALSRVFIPLKIQMAITISESPIKSVSSLACSSPKILATICWCRGTMLSTLQKSPLINQTVAIK